MFSMAFIVAVVVSSYRHPVGAELRDAIVLASWSKIMRFPC